MVAVGSWGDIGPLITRGSGLSKVGYEVLMVTHAAYADDVLNAGLDFAPLSGDPVTIPEGEQGRRWIESGGNGLAFSAHLVSIARPLLMTLLEETYEACRSCMAIIHTPFASFAPHVAERIGVPVIVVGQQPVTRTAAWRAFLAPESVPLGSIGNRLSYRLMEQAVWLPFRSQYQRWRRNAGMPLASPFGLADRLYSGQTPVLYGFSSLVVPSPSDWPPWHRATGYWSAPERSAWSSSDSEVEAFIDAGDPPVFVGFGSMTARNPTHLLTEVVKALRSVGRRGLLATAAGALPAELEASDMLIAKGFSHVRALPRVAAAVHHGGAGTVAASLTAGIPTVVVPFFADQVFWGHRVEALGAGPASLPVEKLTAVALAERLHAALESESILVRAAELGANLRKEDGVTTAVELIDRALEAGFVSE